MYFEDYFKITFLSERKNYLMRNMGKSNKKKYLRPSTIFLIIKVTCQKRKATRTNSSMFNGWLSCSIARRSSSKNTAYSKLRLVRTPHQWNSARACDGHHPKNSALSSWRTRTHKQRIWSTNYNTNFSKQILEITHSPMKSNSNSSIKWEKLRGNSLIICGEAMPNISYGETQVTMRRV